MNESAYGLAALWSQGDAVMKTVAALLLAMSILTWTVIVLRAWQLASIKRAARLADQFWHQRSFDEGLACLHAQGRDNPFALVAQEGEAARDHHDRSREDLHGQISRAEWLTESLRGAIDERAEALGRGLPILASVGSTAPFIGLFGTVWGIYHALIGLAGGGAVSMERVAGPVGEALVMTAFGLAVAIPAVLAYNTLTRANQAVLARLHRFARQLHAYFLTGAPRTAKGA